MPTTTYTPLANVTLSATASSVTFSSIGQGFRDLVLVANPIWDGSGNTQMQGRINGDTGSNYLQVFMEGDGTSLYSNTYGPSSFFLMSYNFGTLTTTIPAPVIVNIMDYSATDKHKTLLVRNNSASAGVGASVTRWASTAAITSFTFTPLGFAAGSTFALYGIAA